MTATATKAAEALADGGMTPASKAPGRADLDGLERDAESKLAECEGHEARLALDALTDPKLAEELRGVQRERAAAEGQLRQAKMAREEIARREKQRGRDAAQAVRLAALREAQELQARKRAAAKAADTHARAYAKALADFASASGALKSALSRARQRPPADFPGDPERGLRLAMTDAGVPRGIIDFAGMTLRIPAKSLADSVAPIPGEDGKDLEEIARRSAPPEPPEMPDVPAGIPAPEVLLPGVTRVKL